MPSDATRVFADERAVVVLGLVVALFAFVNLAIGVSPPGSAMFTLAPFASVGLMSAFALVHGLRTFGVRTIVVFFTLAFGISWSYETLSILTGFPFGHYHYSDRLGPKLWLVPLLIMPAYFTVCYLSWRIAPVLLGRYGTALERRDLVVRPLVAASIMVMWDLSMDPARSTLDASWVWRDGGAYFGVPFVNFVGWFLCVYTIFQAFALYLWRTDVREPSRPLTSAAAWWRLPVLMYGALTVEFLAVALVAENTPLTAPDGTVWQSVDMYRALALVCVFTMGFVTLLALQRLRDGVHDARRGATDVDTVG